MARYRRNVAVMEQAVVEEVAAPARRRVRVPRRTAASEAAPVAPAISVRPRRTAPRFDVSKEAHKAIEAAKKHTITLTLPNGEEVKIPGYATRRAANIDGKAMLLAAKRALEEGTGLPVAVGTVKGGPKDQKRRSRPKNVTYKETSRDVGYTFDFGGGGRALTGNPRLRHNTHLAVGTKVAYKGKAARVVKQHPKDKYTIRFDATGAEMISPGFLLVRR